MCGIAGFLAIKQPLPAARLSTMLDALKHRGPDGTGRLLLEDSAAGLRPVERGGPVHAALGHTRLAIMDLSESGREPMGNEDGSLWLTFNGEIYNFPSLRSDLLARGHRFQSQCDAEVLLHGYEQHGTEFFHRLHGMYAFALLDLRARALYLHRDAFGIKPLVVAERDGAVAFASELRALEDAGFCGGLNRDALATYLALGYVPAPYAMRDGVRKVAPGACLKVDASGVQTLWTAQPPLPATERLPRLMTTGDIQTMHGVLQESVRAHLMADVEVGTFLSGGIDSALVTAAMVDVHAGQVQAFTMAVADPALDETEAARAVARELGVRHHVRHVGAGDAIARLPAILGALDEPLADASILPTRLVSEFAREHVKVVLSGDGGDELLGGYTRHHVMAMMERLRPVASLSGHAGAVIRLTLGEGGLNAAYTRASQRLGLPPLKSPARKLLAATQALTDARALAYGRLFRTGLVSELEAIDVDNSPGDRHLLDAARGFEQASPLSLAQAIDLRSWLPFDILTKVDRASMAVGLEARVPMISSAFAGAAAALPKDALRRGITGKRVLRAMARERFGRSHASARKRGFGLPLQQWLAGPLRAWRQECLGSLSTRGLLPEKGLQSLQHEHDGGIDHGALLFALCALELWLAQRPSVIT